jgi:hypothetical protein
MQELAKNFRAGVGSPTMAGASVVARQTAFYPDAATPAQRDLLAKLDLLPEAAAIRSWRG